MFISWFQGITTMQYKKRTTTTNKTKDHSNNDRIINGDEYKPMVNMNYCVFPRMIEIRDRWS
jgi:hypothetical protein